MSTTFQRCDVAVELMADSILKEFPSHQPLLDAGVKIDFVFALCDPEHPGPALKHHGVAALGVCRIIKLKDRALGRADAEIALDGDWWATAPEPQKRALLDHELHHLTVQTDKKGNIKTDDLQRPKLGMRKHDVEFGWFKVVAARHGNQSMERAQASRMMEESGQYFWPELKGEPPPENVVPMAPVVNAMKKFVGGLGESGIESMTISSGSESVTITKEDSKRMVENCDKLLRQKVV